MGGQGELGRVAIYFLLLYTRENFTPSLKNNNSNKVVLNIFCYGIS